MMSPFNYFLLRTDSTATVASYKVNTIIRIKRKTKMHKRVVDAGHS